MGEQLMAVREISVGSGDYILGKNQDEKLEALLGTCVGVVIIDQDAKVGGLFHILLPDPAGRETPWGPATYASTGFPLFLQALLDSGATKEKMKASVAGGALIGPVSMTDLNLDIGGRTVEVVESLLKQNRIKVEKSETGGYFGSRLTLNMNDLSSAIEPLGFRSHTITEEIKKLSKQELDRAVSKVRPIPQVALKIIRTVHSRNYSMKDISRDVRKDQVISAKVINVCNSVYASPQNEIKSIDQALVMLGEKLLMQLVVSSALEQFFHDSDRGYSMCKGGLYHHAMSTAKTAELIAKSTGKSEEDVAYTAGLLHDIGKVVLDQYVANFVPLFYRRVFTEGENLEDVERQILGVSHTDAGERLAELWGLPDVLKEAIVYHSMPEKATLDPDLTHIVYLADLLVSRFNVGNELERIETKGLKARLKKLGISKDDLPKLVGTIPWKMFEKNN
jgi:putative nucleotidyltransferase with HDIG domain